MNCTLKNNYLILSVMELMVKAALHKITIIHYKLFPKINRKILMEIKKNKEIIIIK